MALWQCLNKNRVGNFHDNAILTIRARIVKCFLLGLGPEAIEEAFNVRC